MSGLLRNLSAICRVCLEHKDNMLSIYELHSEVPCEPFYNMIMNCASVKIRKGDGLPELLCDYCRGRLEAAYFFKRECEQSDFKLREIVCGIKPDYHMENADTDNLENSTLPQVAVKMELDIAETEIIHYGNHESDLEDPLCPTMYVTTELRNSRSPEITTQDTLERTRGEFMCPVCSRKFDLKSNMIAHIWQYHRSNRKTTREVGEKTCSDNLVLDTVVAGVVQSDTQTNHDAMKTDKSIRNCKLKKLKYVCYVCGKRFATKSECKEHKENHSNLRYICDVENCDKQFSDYFRYAAHRKNDHLIENFLSCPNCDKTFNDKKNLDRHLLIKHYSEDRTFNCDQCSKIFRDNWTLKSHMESHLKVFNCELCEKKFASLVRLTNHTRIHNRDKPFTCEECGKNFSQKSNMDKHINATHKGVKRSRREKNHLCPHCGQTFGRPVDLTTHIRIHTGVKPFSCEQCEYRCHDKQLLRSHVRKHTGDRPYRCSYCEKSFGTRSYLIIHERFHSGHRPYICTSCQKGFTNSKDLKVHERTHTGIKLFTCNICSNSFTTLHYLRVHVKKHETSQITLQ